MRDKDFDVDAFPELFPEGSCGLDYENRKKALSRFKYFAQRMMNENPMYRENPDYVFMAQQACERYAIESQIKMAMSHGSIDSNKKGEPVLVPSDDVYMIFQKIAGTPAYWKYFRNELYSKMETLGPFHLFFTISCAEMRWACVLLEVLKVKLNRTLKVMYLDNFIKVIKNKKVNDEETNDDAKFPKEEENEIKRDNVAWNGEANTLLIYDRAITTRDTQSKPPKHQTSEWRAKREKRLREQLLQIIKQRDDLVEKEKNLKKQYEIEMDEEEKEITKNDLENIREKLEEEKPFIFKLEDEEAQEFIDFIIDLEDEENELKIGDVKHIATSYDKNERSKIMTLETYLDRYLKQHSMNKTNFLKDHFILITQLFDKRARDFIDTVMKQKGIEDYCFRVEFQLRGLPHIHGVAWLNFPEEDKIELFDETGSFIIHGDNKDGLNTAVINLIEKWISCSKSKKDEEKLNRIVEECQVHRHTKKSCLKRGNGCRFDFPRPPSNRTLISRPVQNVYPEKTPEEQEVIIQKAKEVMTIVKKALEDLEDDCFEYDYDLKKFLDEKCEEKVSIEEYHKLLQISTSGSTVILKRKVSDRFVNNFNEDFQKHWNANTDIQICLDSFAVVTYITDYLTKSDNNLTKTLITALKEKRGADRFDLLNHLKRTYFKSKQTCICEAAYRLIPGLDLKGSSLSCMFVASGFPHKRKKYVDFMDKKDNKEYDPIEDGEINENLEEQYLFPENETPKSKKKQVPKFKKVIPMENKILIEPESKHSKYELRPKDSGCGLFCEVKNKNVFEDMCFAKFCILYEYNNKEPETALWHIIKENETKNCDVTLDMIKNQVKKNKKNLKKTSKSSNELNEEENESDDDDNDGEEKENNVSISIDELAKMNSSLPSKLLRWGPPKDKKVGRKITNKKKDSVVTQPSVKSFFPTQATYEIGYTKRYFSLINKMNTVRKILTYEIENEGPMHKIEEMADKGNRFLLPQWIRLSNGRTMKLRMKPFALRLYSFPKDLLQHQYSELLLFTAWRNEKEEFWLCDDKKTNSDDPEFENKLLKKKKDKNTEWEKNRIEILPFSKKMTAIKELMENENFQRSKTLYDLVNPQTEQQNKEDAANFDVSDEEDDFPEVPEERTSTKKKKDKKKKNDTPLGLEKCIFKKSILPEEKNELFQTVRLLTFEQRVVFDKYIHYLQSIKCAKHGGDIIPEPPRIIVHGKWIKIVCLLIRNKD